MSACNNHEGAIIGHRAYTGCRAAESTAFSFQTWTNQHQSSLLAKVSRGELTLSAHWTSFLRSLLFDPGYNAVHMERMVTVPHD